MEGFGLAMDCPECKQTMRLEFVGDTGTNGHYRDKHSYAYNVYHCNSCIIIVKEDVWHNAGTVTILHNSSVQVTKKAPT